MDLERLDKIKKLVVIAMFSDDALMETLVLKGGNAIDLIYGTAMRGSIDLDFSMEADFEEKNIGTLRQRFEELLNATLHPEGHHAFDVTLTRRPSEISQDLEHFWGGYRLELKVISLERFRSLEDAPRQLRMAADSIAPGHRKKLMIDMSRYEYCQPKQEQQLEGFTVYVYTPEMIVCEKMRAICQQTTEYREMVRSRARSPRAKDFFDIYTVVEHYKIDLTSPANQDLLKRMFEVKEVPLRLLGEVHMYRGFHATAFPSVRDTVKPEMQLHEFDFYFEYVLRQIDGLKSLWEE